MRNLKRALSLLLSSAMVIGMMVMGSSAASYTDVTSEENVEAIEVLKAVGVMTGDENGNFNPNKQVTRAEMAVVMANLLDLKVEDFKGASLPFTDVPEWAVPYVAACYADGITAGISATEYGSNNSVTTAQAALMMMKALGYFQLSKDFGSDWMVATVKQGSKIELFDGITAGASDAMTRNDVAQLTLNTLESTMVETDGTNTTITLPGGITIDSGDTKYEDRTTSKYDYDKTDDDSDGLLQLCENLYGDDLQKTDKSDDFGRPGCTWKYDGDAVAFGSDKPMATYAGADFDADVVKDLKKDYTFGKTFYNGAEIDKDYEDFEECNGVTVELYANDQDVITVVVTEAYVAELTTINTDDNDKVTDVVVTVTEAGRMIGGHDECTITIDAEDDEDAYALVKNYEEDDVFMAFLKPGWDDVNNDQTPDSTGVAANLLAVANVETVEGKVTAKSADATYNGWLKIDGEKYEFANEYSQAAVGTDDEGIFYIYNGYIVHFDGEAAASEDYLYVVRANQKAGTWNGEMSYYAEVVYADGTSEVIDTKELANEGWAYSYKYNEKKDYYELTAAGQYVEANITKGKTAIGGDYTADGKTVYVSIKMDDGAFDSAKVYTGYKNVPSMKGGAIVMAEAGKAADYVFILDGTTSASADDLIYIAGDSVSKLITDTELGEYYTYDAVVDGKVTEIMVAKEAGNELDGLYATYAVDDDGIYSDLKNATPGEDKDYLTTAGDFKKASNEVITVGNAGTMAYTDNVTVYVIEDGDITVGSINRNYTGCTEINYTVNSDGAVTALYIVK